MKRTIITLFITLTVISGLFAKSNEVYFTFESDSREQLNEITKIISIDNVKDGKVYAYANKTQLQNFEKLNINYTVLPHPGSLITPEMADTRDGMRDWDVYPTYDAYIAMMYEFQTNYPNLCEIQNIGTTVDGRDILFAKISDNVGTEEAEPEFMYTATMHGDETAGYVLMLRLIDYLLSNYTTDTQVSNIVDNIEIWINPLANPDGTYAGGNSTVSGATRYNSNSVDLNRNFRDPEDGDHPDGNAWQTETIAMMDLADAHNFVLSANFHGGAEVVNYPWDTWVTLHADDDWYQEISNTYADAAQANSPTGYLEDFGTGITNGYQWYTTNGCRQDYMNYFQGCREVTIEISETKLLPANELDAHWNYNKDSFLMYIEECLYGVRGIVTDQNRAPLDCVISISGHDNNNSEVSTDPLHGNYYRMLYPGTYDITFTAAGYDPITETGVVVTDNAATPLNIQFGATGTTQSLALNSGWNLKSLNVHPADMSPGSVFDTVISDVIQIKDLSQTYDPTLPDYINTLDLLEDGNAYWVNMSNSNTLDITAPAIDVSGTTINLFSGWNLVGYVCQSAQDIELALDGIMSNIVQVKSLTETYDPALPDYINTLDIMDSDIGYWINVSADCDLVYPVPVRNIAKEVSRDAPIWEPVIYPNNSAVLYAVVQIDETTANENDLIGVFVNGECRGVGNISVYEDDAYVTVNINSAGTLETADIMIYNAEADEILDSDISFEFSSGEILGSYPEDLVMIENIATETDNYELELKNYELSNYPNPFNPTTTISFSISNELNEQIKLEIFNVKGQKADQLILNNEELRIGKVIWNAEGFSSGIYYYKLTANGKTLDTKKMLLMK